MAISRVSRVFSTKSIILSIVLLYALTVHSVYGQPPNGKEHRKERGGDVPQQFREGGFEKKFADFKKGDLKDVDWDRFRSDNSEKGLNWTALEAGAIDLNQFKRDNVEILSNVDWTVVKENRTAVKQECIDVHIPAFKEANVDVDVNWSALDDGLKWGKFKEDNEEVLEELDWDALKGTSCFRGRKGRSGGNKGRHGKKPYDRKHPQYAGKGPQHAGKGPQHAGKRPQHAGKRSDESPEVSKKHLRNQEKKPEMFAEEGKGKRGHFSGDQKVKPAIM